jgi:filamentous hemagglutinin family protein
MELVHPNSNPNQNHSKSSFCCRFVSGSLVFAATIFLFASIGLALPQDGQVQSGEVQLKQVTPKRLDVNQTSDKAIIDWKSFNIAEGEHTHFQLPSNNSINLSRVIGGQRSDIFGKLSSNGQLMLINPNGVVFGINSRVDVHGLIATTNDIRNQDFLANRFWPSPQKLIHVLC